MGFLGTLVFYIFAWFFVRLKTKKMLIARLIVGSLFLIWNSVGLWLIVDSKNPPVGLIAFFGVVVGLFALRVIIDLILLIRGKFEERETFFDKYRA